MINVAILGFGTVGSGVADVLTMNAEKIAKHLGQNINLKYILDVRDFPDSPYAGRFIKDFAQIESDNDLQIVVETIGGARIAYEFTKRALTAGKSVITSNKELVATHGYELLQMAKEHHCSYLFEASVGGGIPCLEPLNSCLAANEIEEIAGILNGTTNYILTRMIRAGLSFDAALAEAQANGYAERDPSADIEGKDACRKTCILSAIAYGEHVYPEQVPTEGITNVTLEDVAYASSEDYKIKLLGRTIKMENGICAFVAPHLVHTSLPLSAVEDVFNAVQVTGNAVGDVMFYGRGAGKLPTASAVVGDVIEAAKYPEGVPYWNWGPGNADMMVSPDVLESRFYVRAESSVDAIKAALGEVVFMSRENAPAGEAAFISDKMTLPRLKELCANMEIKSVFRVF